MITAGPTEGYELDDDPRRLDRDAIWTFMSEQANWGRWRSREIVDTQIERSWRTVGAYDQSTGDLVGFARAISDSVSLAYLADVYVVPTHRGRGLGEALVRSMVDTAPTFRWMLHTHDAHGLYARYGFAPPSQSYLERPGDPPASTGAGA